MQRTNGNQELERVLDSDSRVGGVPVPLWVVAGGMTMTPRDLAALGDRDSVIVAPFDRVRLSAGGVDVALGRIVDEGDHTYFEVEEVL